MALKRKVFKTSEEEDNIITSSFDDENDEEVFKISRIVFLSFKVSSSFLRKAAVPFFFMNLPCFIAYISRSTTPLILSILKSGLPWTRTENSRNEKEVEYKASL